MINKHIVNDVKLFKSKYAFRRFIKDDGQYDNIKEYKRVSGYDFAEGKNVKECWNKSGYLERNVYIREYNCKTGTFE